RFSLPEPAGHLWQIPEDVKREKESLLEKLIISVVQKLTKVALSLWIKVNIHQPENWDKNRAEIVIVNHQSGLDPFIIGAFLDRKIAFLTKSTSFAHFLPRYFLKWLMGLPTTRYKTDPGIIYTIKKFLGAGIKVGIFPEGERTWSGKMQPFKVSFVKVLMASRQPVCPLILKNAFVFWPRWAKFPRRATVDIYSGAPFCLVPNLFSIDEQKQFLEDYFRKILGE
ncbi:MAG: lysophospholipid acyltransferase family protein, partial [Calditrichia bacterium]